MKKSKIIILIFLFIVFSFLKLKQNNIIDNYINIKKEEKISYPAKVNRVIDGDTLEIEFLKEKPLNCSNIEKVRMIGLNSPELNLKTNKNPEYFAEEAYIFTKTELENQFIEIVFDNYSSQKDIYERLLCYVYIDNFLFNKILIERGFAFYYDTYQFNKDLMFTFEKAEDYAKQNKLGLWRKNNE